MAQRDVLTYAPPPSTTTTTPTHPPTLCPPPVLPMVPLLGHTHAVPPVPARSM